MYALGARVSHVFRDSSDLNVLQSENEKLRDENTDLMLKISSLQQAQEENITLRSLLDFFESDTSSLPRALARVVSRDQANPSILTLNVGQRDGVQVDNAVIVKDGVLVAKIIDVYARTSRAVLLSDSDVAVAATVSGGSPTSKIVRGERGLSLILDQVPQHERLESGQLIMTSGLEAAIPRGLLIGEVEEIISQKNDLFQTSVLRPLVDYNSLTIVAVILTPSTSL
jgi:rod shape-determining protein MreC